MKAKYYLKELNLDMGKEEYLMYQDIPNIESGSHNLCNGIAYELFTTFLERELSRQYQQINKYDTPVKIYIMYVDEKPVGYIGLRTEINNEWKIWSGNFYYAIRMSERGKGYGNKILGLGIKKFKEWGYSKIYGVSSENNIISSKVIEYNGGILEAEDEKGRYYRIEIK